MLATNIPPFVRSRTGKGLNYTTQDVPDEYFVSAMQPQVTGHIWAY